MLRLANNLSKLDFLLFNMSPNCKMDELADLLGTLPTDDENVHYKEHLLNFFPSQNGRKYALIIWEAFLDMPLDTDEKFNNWQKIINIIDAALENGELDDYENIYSSLSDEEIAEDYRLRQLYVQGIAFTTNGSDVKGLESKLAKAVDNDYAVLCDREDMPGIKIFADELSQHDQFSYLFTVIFLLITLLVIMTTMSRIVSSQRTQIGTMSAIGMPRWKITLHYLGYSFFVSLLGSISGLYIGTYTLGELVAKVFRAWYILPGWDVEMDNSFIVVAITVVAVCTFATWLSCKNLLKVDPAEALRPAPPKAGKSCIWDKLPFWEKLSFNIQYNLRDFSRNKLRAIMAFFGTAAGMMIMSAAFFSYSTLNGMSKWNFENIQNYKNEVDFENNITLSECEKIKDKYTGELIMTGAIEVAKMPKAPADERKSASIIVTEGEGLYGITDVNLKPVTLKKGTVAITMKLAKRLKVEKGDTIYWHLYEKTNGIKHK